VEKRAPPPDRQRATSTRSSATSVDHRPTRARPKLPCANRTDEAVSCTLRAAQRSWRSTAQYYSHTSGTPELRSAVPLHAAARSPARRGAPGARSEKGSPGACVVAGSRFLPWCPRYRYRCRLVLCWSGSRRLSGQGGGSGGRARCCPLQAHLACAAHIGARLCRHRSAYGTQCRAYRRADLIRMRCAYQMRRSEGRKHTAQVGTECSSVCYRVCMRWRPITAIETQRAAVQHLRLCMATPTCSRMPMSDEPRRLATTSCCLLVPTAAFPRPTTCRSDVETSRDLGRAAAPPTNDRWRRQTTDGAESKGHHR